MLIVPLGARLFCDLFYVAVSYHHSGYLEGETNKVDRDPPITT